MKPRLSVVLLACSAALNVSFVAGYLQARRALGRLQTQEGRAEWAAGRLGLDEQQRQGFLRLNAEWRREAGALQRARAADAEVFWAGAIGQAADPQELREAQARLAEGQAAATALGMSYLTRTMQLLTPEQRRALAEMIRQRNRL